MATDYGKRLREARKHAKLTQQGLSDRTGIPQSTISTAESNGNGGSDTIYAKACGVDAHWLATGMGEMLQFVRYNECGPALVFVTAIQRACMPLEKPKKARISLLLSQMATDPAGPWAQWAAELLDEKPARVSELETAPQIAAGLSYSKGSQGGVDLHNNPLFPDTKKGLHGAGTSLPKRKTSNG